MRIFVLFLFSFVCSCSLIKQTTVNKVKNTGLNRTTHGFSSKYNIYSNGKISYEQGQFLVNSSPEKNIDLLLPVFKYNAVSEDVKVYFEYTIKKSLKVIGRHSIREGGYEYSPYVDDAFVLAGKAAYCLGIYDEAFELFRYFSSNFGYSPLYDEATIWKAKTLIRLSDIKGANEYLNEINFELLPFEKDKKEWYLTKTDLYIAQKEYDSAITTLNSALRLSKINHERNRLYFLKGQLYELINQPFVARNSYKKLLLKNVPYDMFFLSSLRLKGTTPVLTARKFYLIHKKLDRGYKTDINAPFRDEITATIGLLSLRLGRKADAISFFDKAFNESTNNYRKVKYAQGIAEIYHADKNYPRASEYYKKGAAIVQEDDPSHSTLKKKAEIFTSFSELLKKLDLHEEALRLSILSEEERAGEIEKIKQKRLEAKRASLEKEKEQIERQEKEIEKYFEEEQEIIASNRSGSEWYFTDEKRIKSGREKFNLNWNNRPNVDNWRVLSKIKKLASQTKSIVDSLKVSAEVSGTLTERMENFLKKSSEEIKKASDVSDITTLIPKDKNEKEKIHATVEETLFILGKRSYYDMNDEATATAYFTRIVEEYPGRTYDDDAYFLLYLMARRNSNEPEMRRMFAALSSKYPNSKFVRLIEEDAIDESFEATEAQIMKKYEKIYALLLSKKYEETIQEADAFSALHSVHERVPYVLYLKASAMAKLRRRKEAVLLLKEITGTYPEKNLISKRIVALFQGKEKI